jgi:hypothetical protein
MYEAITAATGTPDVPPDDATSALEEAFGKQVNDPAFQKKIADDIAGVKPDEPKQAAVVTPKPEAVPPPPAPPAPPVRVTVPVAYELLIDAPAPVVSPISPPA